VLNLAVNLAMQIHYSGFISTIFATNCYSYTDLQSPLWLPEDLVAILNNRSKSRSLSK